LKISYLIKKYYYFIYNIYLFNLIILINNTNLYQAGNSGTKGKNKNKKKNSNKNNNYNSSTSLKNKSKQNIAKNKVDKKVN